MANMCSLTLFLIYAFSIRAFADLRTLDWGHEIRISVGLRDTFRCRCCIFENLADFSISSCDRISLSYNDFLAEREVTAQSIRA
jgi:hypothetical protein